MFSENRNKQYVIMVVAIVMALPVISLIWLARPLKDTDRNINDLGTEYLIAHAGGGINGKTYTNSKNALVASLEKGFNYIELDLCQLSNGEVVCAHDSLRCVVDSLMTLQDAIDIWKCKHFFFVTDKISDPSILNKYFMERRSSVYVETGSIVEYSKLLDYGYKPMLSVAGDLRGVVKSLLASLYNGKIIERVVTHYTAQDYVLRIYKHLGLKTAVYTVNDESYLEKHIGKDIDLVYTDFLSPAMKQD